MLPLQDLRFAQSYPFSKTAMTVVKQSGLSINAIPIQVMQRAILMLENSLTGKKYSPAVQESAELIQNEILAFPVAKILLSYSKNYSYFERFAEMIAENAFQKLEFEKKEVLLDFAQEFEIEFELFDDKDFFAAVKLESFLKIPQHNIGMRLVNQKLENGMVFLTREEFAKLIAEAVRLKVLQSLPVDLKGMPKEFQKISFEIFSKVSERQKQFLQKAMHGKITIENFPPCFSELYAKLNSGEQLTHLGNFTLASFLIAIGTPKEQIFELFKKAPNFDEKITKYHLERMTKGKKYTPASCITMRSYALCIQNGELCPSIKNPLQYYRRKNYSNFNGEN